MSLPIFAAVFSLIVATVILSTSIEAIVIENHSVYASSPSNSKLSLPSSSTFSNPFNRSDTYRKEEPETFHNSKGDISD